MKRGLICIALVLVLSLSFISAFSFGDLFHKNTGKVIANEDKIIFYAATENHNGNFGGRSGADNFCSTHAPSGLSCGNVHAFLSVNPEDEIRDMPSNYDYSSTESLYWYSSTTGALVKFANNWEDSLDGSIEVNIKDGTGKIMNYNYWTGSYVDGSSDELRDPGYGTCNGWTSMSAHGTRGDYNKNDSNWIYTSGKYICSRDDGAVLCVCDGSEEAEEPGEEPIISSCVDDYCTGSNKIIFPLKNQAGMFDEYPYLCKGNFLIDVRGTNWESSCTTGWIKQDCEGFDDCPAEFPEAEKKEFECAGKFCRGYNSKLTNVENGFGISNEGGTYCCDGSWWINISGDSLCCEPGFFLGAQKNSHCDVSNWYACGNGEETNFETEEETPQTSDDFEEEEISQESTCNGCKLNEECYPIGYRKDKQYCSDNSEFVNQSDEDKECENNFECKSNFCISGKCIDKGLMEKIIDWFRNIFSGN